MLEVGRRVAVHLCVCRGVNPLLLLWCCSARYNLIFISHCYIFCNTLLSFYPRVRGYLKEYSRIIQSDHPACFTFLPRGIHHQHSVGMGIIL